MPSANGLCDAAKSPQSLLLAEVPLGRADLRSAGGELMGRAFARLSHTALAELDFQTQVVSQPAFSLRSILLPWVMVFLIISDSYETLITSQHDNPSRTRPQRGTKLGVRKGAAHCRCAGEVMCFVCRCGTSAGGLGSSSYCRHFLWYLKSGLLNFPIKKKKKSF